MTSSAATKRFPLAEIDLTTGRVLICHPWYKSLMNSLSEFDTKTLQSSSLRRLAKSSMTAERPAIAHAATMPEPVVFAALTANVGSACRNASFPPFGRPKLESTSGHGYPYGDGGFPPWSC